MIVETQGVELLLLLLRPLQMAYNERIMNF
jgi:hypothetical protein